MDERQRDNLRALADYLDTGVPEYEFDMEVFFDRNHSCGTAACALGHAPFVLGHEISEAGGGAIVDGTYRSFYCDYSAVVFGFDNRSPGWDWLFGWKWTAIDNTARGAAARIYYFLEHGVPEDARAQMRGEAPLCYTVTPLPEITPARTPVG